MSIRFRGAYHHTTTTNHDGARAYVGDKAVIQVIASVRSGRGNHSLCVGLAVWGAGASHYRTRWTFLCRAPAGSSGIIVMFYVAIQQGILLFPCADSMCALRFRPPGGDKRQRPARPSSSLLLRYERRTTISMSGRGFPLPVYYAARRRASLVRAAPRCRRLPPAQAHAPLLLLAGRTPGLRMCLFVHLGNG
jgi:hypothetical protein